MTLYVRTFQNQEAELLQALATAGSAPFRLVQRARLTLHSAEGYSPPQIASKVGLSTGQTREWIRRFNAHGLLGLFDLPRPGAPPGLTEAQTLRIVDLATSRPATLDLPFKTWSLNHLRRHLAEQEGLCVCRETIRAVLAENGISYQKARSWQQSDDPELESKKQAIVGLYVEPPADTMIICFDQKGPVQFRLRGGYHYRAQGRPARFAHEYQRRGTGYLLAALNPHTGQVWGRCFRKYNSLTVIWFLAWLLRQLPADMRIIIIWDNASQHGKKVKDWLAGRFRERVQWQHTPTKASWLNLIEAWFAMFERDVLQNSDFENLSAFALDVRCYLGYYNAQAHPFRWGRKREKRIYLIRPLRQAYLRGRACAHSLSDRLARRLAKAIITS